MFIRLLMLCILCIGSISTSYADSSHSQQSSLRLELSLEKFEPVAHTIIVQLVVTNIEKHPLVLPHLKEGLLEQYGAWSGWSIQIRNAQNGLFMLRVRRHPTLKMKELIELKPGERFTVQVNIANAIPYHYAEANKKPRPKLTRFTGEYRVWARLALYEGNTPDWFHERGWKGFVESNTIKFVIDHEKSDQSPEQKGQDEER